MAPHVVALITAASDPYPCRRIQKVRRTLLRTSGGDCRTLAFDVLHHGEFTSQVLRELSNFCCLPGRAGGSPNGLDLNLARALRERTADSNVKVQVGDATAMPFHDRTFSVVLSFTMLHHIPSPALQDRLFFEAFRVLKPGGTFAGSDSLRSVWMQIFHLADTMVTLDPEGLPRRLKATGFIDVGVETSGGRVRFWAKRPVSLASGTDSLGEAPERLSLPSEE